MILSGILLLIMVLLSGPLWILISGQLDLKTHWSVASRESSGTAPSPDNFPEASVRVYYARSFNWRGAFGVHSWLALKEKNGKSFQIFQVIGWRLFSSQSSVDVHWGDPARYWYGEEPVLLGEITGVEAEQAIPLIREAAENYPFAWNYRVWPGPNSNTFISHLMRSAGNLPFGLPPNAIGKDYPMDGALFAPTPSNTGWQFSLYGIFGIILSSAEGIRLQLLGLEFGWNPLRGECYWPGIGILSYY